MCGEVRVLGHPQSIIMQQRWKRKEHQNVRYVEYTPAKVKSVLNVLATFAAIGVLFCRAKEETGICPRGFR
jgi:hypothetical protein